MVTKSLKLTNRKTVFRNVSKSGTKKGRRLAASGLIINDASTQVEHIGSAYMSNEEIDSDWLFNND